MAKPSWLVLDKTSGTGNGTVKASVASQYYGRLSRSGSIVVTSTKDTSKKATVNVTNSAYGEFLRIDNDQTTVIASAGTIQIASDASDASEENVNQTNCKYLIYKVDGDINITAIKVSYRIGTVGPSNQYIEITDANITSNTDGSKTLTIPDDPGASNRLDLLIEITITANETISVKRSTMELGGTSSAKPTKLSDAVEQRSIQITQKAKNVTLSVSPTSITIPAAGTAQTITVTSNDAWTIS
jgi:hypothetical protein